MSASGSTRQSVLDHLTAAAFETRIAAGFECLKNTPAHASLQAAEVRIAEARAWVVANVASQRVAPIVTPASEALPLTRKERLSFRHLRLP